jgi:hypothetical protein
MRKSVRARGLAVLVALIMVLTVFPTTAFGETNYITPPKSDAIKYTIDVLSGQWSFHQETLTIAYYQGIQLTNIEDEKLTLNADGTFRYDYSKGMFPVNPITAEFNVSESDSGTYSVSGEKITFVSSGKLNGTRSVFARCVVKDSHDLITMDGLHNDLARSGFGKLSEDGHVRVDFLALYALEVGDLYVGFGKFGGASVDVLSDGSYFVVEMYMGADVVNGEDVSGLATTDSVKSISANVLLKGKSPVPCNLIMVPMSLPGYKNLINYYELRVSKSALDSKTTNFRYIEVSLNGKAFLLDTTKGFLSAFPSDDEEENEVTDESGRPSVADTKSFQITVPDATFTGVAKASTVTVTYNGKTLVKGKDYTVTYKNNKAIGKATAIIQGIGKYSGTKTVTFKIVPKKTSITKVTVGAKQFKVTWKAVPAAQKITKYQVRYKVKGAKGWSSSKTVSAKVKSLTVKKLTKGKTYQIQVRSYKTVKGARYYSAWSKTKTSGKIK